MGPCFVGAGAGAGRAWVVIVTKPVLQEVVVAGIESSEEAMTGPGATTMAAVFMYQPMVVA